MRQLSTFQTAAIDHCFNHKIAPMAMPSAFHWEMGTGAAFAGADEPIPGRIRFQAFFEGSHQYTYALEAVQTGRSYFDLDQTEMLEKHEAFGIEYPVTLNDLYGEVRFSEFDENWTNLNQERGKQNSSKFCEKHQVEILAENEWGFAVFAPNGRYIFSANSWNPLLTS